MQTIDKEKHGMPFHNNHNVFILGAGFSVDAGLPTMKTFIPAMRHAVRWADNMSLSDLRENIIESLSIIASSAKAAYRCKIDPSNIEDVFSLFDGGLENKYDGRFKRTNMQKAIAATLESRMDDYRQHKKAAKLVLQDFVQLSLNQAYISSLSTNAEATQQKFIPLYEACSALLANCFSVNGDPFNNPKNTIITFNYDTLLEESLEEMSIAYNLGITNNEGIDIDSQCANMRCDNPLSGLSILKLHGSMNWALKFRAHDNQHEKSELYKSRPSLTIYKNATDLFNDDAHLYDQLILEPPTWNKGKSAPILQLLWDKSIEALSTATRIFIIGYSVPETDMHFKYLMATGLANNISLEDIFIVNPSFDDSQESSRLKTRIFNTFREELEHSRTIKFLPLNACDFMLAPAGNKSLHHPHLLPFVLFPTLSHSFFA